MSSDEEYVQYCERTMPPHVWLLLVIFILLGQFPLFFAGYILDIIRSNESKAVGVSVIGVVWMAFLLVIICLNYLYVHIQANNKDGKFCALMKPYATTLRGLLVLCALSFYSFRLVTSVINGSCDSSDLSGSPSTWTCNPLAASRGLPPESLLTLMIMQVLFSIVLRDVHVLASLLSWVVSTGALGVAIGVGRAASYYYIASVYVIISAFVLMETRRYNAALYRATMELRGALKENEVMANQVIVINNDKPFFILFILS